jgi:RNA polymerase sigma-70 factor (ECF subfamily)
MVSDYNEDLMRHLINEAKCGSEQALNAIFGACCPKLLRYYLRFLGKQQDAEDLTQETCLRIKENIKRYKEKGRFWGWLFRVAANILNDFLRKRKRESTYQQGLHNSWKGVMAQKAERFEPFIIAEHEELKLLVAEAIASLPKKMRDVVSLRYFEELKEKEIAGILGITEGTVKSRLHYARLFLYNKLRDKLGKM